MRILSGLFLSASCTIVPKVFEMQASFSEAKTLGFEDDLDALNEFKNFEENYNKSYEFQERKIKAKRFLENFNKIRNHNKLKLSWTMGINEFADMSFEEFKDSRLMIGQDCSATSGLTRSQSLDYIRKRQTGFELPDETDWRQKGGVSPVKNQGHCGSCWTFSTTGCLESAHAIHHGNYFNLSEQQLVDCAQDYDNHGCNGGLPSHAFEYIMSVGGLEEENDYDYHAVEGACQFKEKLAKATVNEAFNITQGDEDQLTLAIAYWNPVSIAFEVVDDFRFYKEGVYQSTECKSGPTDVNHAVLAVGYGTCKKCDTPFYIVKNSWGATWGDEGFFKIQRGQNMCGVATCSSFPIV